MCCFFKALILALSMLVFQCGFKLKDKTLMAFVTIDMSFKACVDMLYLHI